jgi:hypothetical protein
MDDLPELRDTELGNDVPALRKVCESLADLGHLKLAAPRTNPLKVIDGRGGEADPTFARHVR